MESGLSITAFSTRRGKRLQMANAAAAVEEDIISNKLPESIISDILSLLPTKDAVRTCVLSKRWKDRWTSITKLDLHDHSHKPKGQRGRIRHNFVNFVNRALVLTGGLGGLTMERLSLLIRGKYNVSLLDTWLSNIFNRRVKNLRIHSHFKLNFSALASHYLFNSSTSSLEELEFLVTNSISTIKVPHINLHFGHLKLLNLCGIFFNFDLSDGYSFLSFPVLKKFETKNCSWIGAKGVSVDAPLLETISIEQEATIRTTEESHVLSPNSFLCIRFGVLHLKEFTYCGYGISRVIYLADFSRRFDEWSTCSASAKIILNPSENEVDTTIAIALQLLQQFSLAKSIIFEGSEVLTEAQLFQQTLPRALPVFAMLSHLELGLAAVEVILVLLQKTPVLKTLVLKGVSKFAEELLKSAVVPDCLASLRVVKFEKVNGDKHEIFLANFFMENGMMLERMSFYFDSQRPAILEVMQEFKEKLYSCKRFSVLKLVKGRPYLITLCKNSFLFSKV